MMLSWFRRRLFTAPSGRHSTGRWTGSSGHRAGTGCPSLSPRPRRHTWSGLLVLAVVALISSACSSSSSSPSSSASSATKTPILLGMITPLTGGYEPLGINNRKGAELAVSQINAAGGIDGRKINLVVENDDTTASQAIVDLKSLVGQGAAAIIGSSFSNDSLAAEPVAEQDKIPYISTASDVRQVQPVRKYVYMSPPTTINVGQRLLEYFQAKHLTRVAVAYESDSAFALSGYQVQQQMASRYGINVVTAQPFTANTTDFSTLLTHVAAAHPQVLMVWGTAAPPVILTKQLAAAHLGFLLAMSHAESTYLYADPVGSAGNGVIIASTPATVAPYLPNGAMRTESLGMVNAFQAAYHVYPPEFAFDAYSAVELAAAAARKGGGTRTGIESGLQHLNLLMPDGYYTYTPTNHSGLHTSDISIDRLENTTFTITAWAKHEFQTASSSAS